MTSKDSASPFGRFRDNKLMQQSLLGILLPASGVMTAYTVAEPTPRDFGFKVERVLEELPPVYIEVDNSQSSYWAQEAMQMDDSLVGVLMRMGMVKAEIKQITAKSNPGRNMNRLHAGQPVSVRVNASGQITDAQFFTDEEFEHSLVALEKANGEWQASTSETDVKTVPTLRPVIVRTSACGAMVQAEIPMGTREPLSEIFTDMLNLEDLKEGGTVRLLHNNMYFRGQQMGAGDILAAGIVKGDKTYQVYYYSQDKGDEENGSYYDQNGKSLQQEEGFNAQPTAYTCISSSYGYRVHPALYIVYIHTGIDYVVPESTPIETAVDDVVIFKGWKGGCSNTVVIQHASGVETLYGHVSVLFPSRGEVYPSYTPPSPRDS